MFRIPGYEPGANITILNTIYHKRRKDPESGKYLPDSIDIIYKDLDTGEKKLYHIKNPKYTYYVSKEKLSVNRLAIEKDKVVPVECRYSDLLKDIATHTNNLDFFYDNCRCGNFKENEKLLYIPSIFRADMNIEDYYRLEFSKTYKNDDYTLSKLYFDIEVDGINMRGDFPESGECPVNAVTIIDEKNQYVHTLLLDNPDNALIDEFKHCTGVKERLKKYIENHVGGWKNTVRHKIDKFEYNILFYNNEIRLIADFFQYINNTKPDFAIAWNIAFDIVYLIDRIKTLGYDPASIICHKDFPVKEAVYYVDTRADKFEERNDFARISTYTVFIDQLILFASRRKGQRKLYSYKLDYIGEHIAKVKKLDYSHITTDIMKFPYLDYMLFVFYNIIDTIVQHCIEVKTGDIDFLFNKSLTTCTRYAKIHRQTTYLANQGIHDFEEMGYIMGNNINKNNPKQKFPGAFVADPALISDKPKKKINGRPINVTDTLDDFDYCIVAA